MSTEPTKSNNSRSADQRYFPRWEVNNRVLYQVETQVDIMQGKTKDMSCAGVCISFDKPIDRQKIKLTFFLFRNTSIIVEGNVLWTNERDDDNIETGISFTEITPQAQDLILKHAFNVNKDQLINHWFDGWNDKIKL